MNGRTNNSKAENLRLKNYLNNLSVKESPKMVKKLTKECKVSLSTFRNWRFGLARIPELAKDKIEEVTGEKIFIREITKQDDVKPIQEHSQSLEHNLTTVLSGSRE